jgi:hypothetical protein
MEQMPAMLKMSVRDSGADAVRELSDINNIQLINVFRQPCCMKAWITRKQCHPVQSGSAPS